MQPKSFTHRYPHLTRILPIKIEVGQPRLLISNATTARFLAIWDTGAYNTMITNKVVRTLKLEAYGSASVHTASSTILSKLYLIDVILPEDIEIPGVRATVGNLPGFDVLLGMDVITSGDFAISNSLETKEVIVSYRIPPRGEISF
ncbi:MAG: retroviral-like aspartic protease family protein [Bifidobacteriaceae bacterium]|jgi:hypothetical protein|nr:retroviral-like aspartic protease family protein [Bifidobacteriaceae bacterium]